MDNQIVFLPSLHLTDSKRDVVTEIFVSPRNGLFSFFRVEATKRNALILVVVGCISCFKDETDGADLKYDFLLRESDIIHYICGMLAL